MNDRPSKPQWRIIIMVPTAIDVYAETLKKAAAAAKAECERAGTVDGFAAKLLSVTRKEKK